MRCDVYIKTLAIYQTTRKKVIASFLHTRLLLACHLVNLDKQSDALPVDSERESSPRKKKRTTNEFVFFWRGIFHYWTMFTLADVRSDSVKLGLEWHFELLSAAKNSTSIMPANLFIFSHLSSFARAMYNLMTIHLNKRDVCTADWRLPPKPMKNVMQYSFWCGMNFREIQHSKGWLLIYWILRFPSTVCISFHALPMSLFSAFSTKNTPQRLQCRQINSASSV